MRCSVEECVEIDDIDESNACIILEDCVEIESYVLLEDCVALDDSIEINCAELDDEECVTSDGAYGIVEQTLYEK